MRCQIRTMFVSAAIAVLALAAGASSPIELERDSIDDACSGYRVKGRNSVVCCEIVPSEQYARSFSIDVERGTVEAGPGGCF